MTKRIHGNAGVRNNHAKLDDDKIRAIFRMWRDNPTLSQATIAKQFGISRNNISRIISRKSWKHVKV